MNLKTSLCNSIPIAAITSIALAGCVSRTYPPDITHVQPYPSQRQATPVQPTISEPVAISPVPPIPTEKGLGQPATPTASAMDLKTKIECILSLRKQGVLTQEEADRLLLRSVEDGK